jgi:hypothetical protein
MAAAGLATAATPFVLGQPGASAAEKRAGDAKTTQFVDDGGVSFECTYSLNVTHDTDEPNQPTLQWHLAVFGDPQCDNVLISTTASYKDVDGITRRSRNLFITDGGGSVEGAYSSPTVTSSYEFFECDPFHEIPCTVTLTATPK